MHVAFLIWRRLLACVADCSPCKQGKGCDGDEVSLTLLQDIIGTRIELNSVGGNTLANAINQNSAQRPEAEAPASLAVVARGTPTCRQMSGADNTTSSVSQSVAARRDSYRIKSFRKGSITTWHATKINLQDRHHVSKLVFGFSRVASPDCPNHNAFPTCTSPSAST